MFEKRAPLFRGLGLHRLGASHISIMRLLLVVGPSWFLTTAVLTGIVMQLWAGSSKEMQLEAETEVLSKSGVDQWQADAIRQLRSESGLYAMLAASLGVQFFGMGGTIKEGKET